MQHVLAPGGLPTPPASPLPFESAKCFVQQQQQHYYGYTQQQRLQQQQQQQPRYVPVAPEDRIGLFLSGSLQLTGVIGTGAYGVVYEAVDIKTNARYAVKALSKFNPDGTPLEQRQMEYQIREIRLHYLASDHPNVVSMYRIIDNYPDCLFVVLEYCPEGDLFYNITERGHFVGRDDLAKRVFLQLLDAVQFLHQNSIYHRDLKPENILVADNGENLKLADFGLATSYDRSEDYGCGSTFYMSPECLGSHAKRPFYFCAPNDVWSLGVILVNLTCGRNPWKQASPEDSTYRTYTRNPGFLKTILPLSDELDAILARIFTVNPDQRITLPELRQRILACHRFTLTPQQQQQRQQRPQVTPAVVPTHYVATPATTPEHEFGSNASVAAMPDYASTFADDEEEDEEEAEMHSSSCQDDSCCYTTSPPPLPASSPSSTYASLASSLTSATSDSCYSPETLVSDSEEEKQADDMGMCMPEIGTPPPILAMHPPPSVGHADLVSSPIFYDCEDASMLGVEAYMQQQQQQQLLQQQQLQHMQQHQQQQHIQQQQQQQQHIQNIQQHLLPSFPFNNVHIPQDHYVSYARAAPMPTPPPEHQHPMMMPVPPPVQPAPVHHQQHPPAVAATQCDGGGGSGAGRFFLPSVWEWMVGKNAHQPMQHFYISLAPPMLPGLY